MDLREIALKLKKWAQANQMIGLSKEAPDVDLATIRSVFRGVGVPAATRILQDRGVSYIGINRANNDVTIFTRKKLTARDFKLLQAAAYHDDAGDISVTFRQGGIGHAGPGAQPPIGIPPYHQHNGRYTCGSSIYVGSEKGAGTLACLLRDPSSGILYGLSNNHITGGSNYAAPGLPIVAPGILDVSAGGMDPTTLGHHEEAYPFVDGLPGAVDPEKNLDAAIFKILDETLVSSMQRGYYDTPKQYGALESNMQVEKVGRTTGRTRGKVIEEFPDFEPIEYEIDIINGRKIVYFQSLFAILGDHEPFAQSGDSGSLIVTSENGLSKAVGIIIAVDGNGLTFALSLDRVIDYFGMELVSEHNT